MLEGVLEVGDERGLVEELARLEVGQTRAQRLIADACDRLEQDEGHITTDDGGRLEQVLLVGRETVDSRRQDGLDAGRNLNIPNRLSDAVTAGLPGERPRLDERTHTLLEKERVTVRALDQHLLERRERMVVAQQRTNELFGAFGRERVDVKLSVVALGAPSVMVLGAVVDEEQDPGGRKALDEPVEDGLGFRIDPVEVFEN